MKKALVWSPKMVPSVPVNSFSPSWRKPKAFMDAALAAEESHGVEVIGCDSAQDSLLKVHSRDYLNGVLTGKKANGFGGFEPEVAQSFLYTCGGMLRGVELAKEGTSSCVPVSGFHHACYDHAQGFCTFNGLALAAIMAKEQGMKPGVLDLDMHFGNGTVDIFSVTDNSDIPHYTFGGTKFGGSTNRYGKEFIERLPKILDAVFKNRCGVLLYQAGADQHVDDPLGGALTTMEMADRDFIVFEWAAANNIPVVWNLAGGYQDPLEKVIALHLTTFKEWVRHG